MLTEEVIMNILLGVLLLAVATFADETEVVQGPVELSTAYKYHERVGIPKAAQIKAAEEEIVKGNARIVGGHAASNGEFPYQVGILPSLISGATSVCGGCLLSNTRVLSTAQCWWDGNDQASFLTVVLGSLLLFNGGTRVNTNSVEVHASWDPWTGLNNIIMVTIPWVSYTNNIGNIGLPTGTLTYANYMAVATGYGSTSNGAAITNSQVKHFVWTSVITNAVCTQSYGSNIVAGRLCTSGANAVGICDGDAGGPLAIESGENKQLIGVSLYGSARACRNGLPSVYLRVTSFLTWINARL